MADIVFREMLEPGVATLEEWRVDVSSREAVGDRDGEDVLCINPALLESPDNMCCCWFDTEVFEPCEASFLAMFTGKRRYYVAYCIARAKGRVLYGVAAFQGRRVSDINHLFAPWVNFIYPVGNESPEEFFTSLAGEFRRANVEPLDGYCVEDLLL